MTKREIAERLDYICSLIKGNETPPSVALNIGILTGQLHAETRGEEAVKEPEARPGR